MIFTSSPSFTQVYIWPKNVFELHKKLSYCTKSILIVIIYFQVPSTPIYSSQYPHSNATFPPNLNTTKYKEAAKKRHKKENNCFEIVLLLAGGPFGHVAKVDGLAPALNGFASMTRPWKQNEIG